MQAYVFIDTENPGPKRIVADVRKIAGVVRGDALFGTPDAIAIVEGDDIATMDAVIIRLPSFREFGTPIRRLCIGFENTRRVIA